MERVEELEERFFTILHKRSSMKKIQSMCTLLLLEKVWNVPGKVSAGCSGNKSVPGGGCLKEWWMFEGRFVCALNMYEKGTCPWWLSPLARRYPWQKGFHVSISSVYCQRILCSTPPPPHLSLSLPPLSPSSSVPLSLFLSLLSLSYLTLPLSLSLSLSLSLFLSCLSPISPPFSLSLSLFLSLSLSLSFFHTHALSLENNVLEVRRWRPKIDKDKNR